MSRVPPALPAPAGAVAACVAACPTRCPVARVRGRAGDGGEQIREALRLHGMMNQGRSALPWPFDGAQCALEKKRVLEVMAEVGIPAPEARYRAYPHEFSGGMQQRALIAIGLACEPAILLADEPTTALDVTIQAQIIELMRRINRQHGTSILLVTHNLGLAAEFCHNIAVMYAGRIVERGPVDQVIQ